jgi:hypothetical protein
MNTLPRIKEWKDMEAQMSVTLPIEARIDRRQRLGLTAVLNTKFMLTCCAKRVYLRLATKDDAVIGLFEMELLECSRWALNLRLRPGTYHYRYYADCGRVTTYVYPGEVEDIPRPMCGLDAILDVLPTGVTATSVPDAENQSSLLF